MEDAFQENCVVRVKPKTTEKSSNKQQFTNTKSADNRTGESRNSISGESRDYSCSGVLIQPSKGLVITSGVAFADFVKQRPRLFSQFSSKPFRHNWFQPGGPPLKNTRYYASKDLESLSVEVGVPTVKAKKSRNVDKFAVYEAELIVLWKCQGLSDEIQRLFPKSDNWNFSEEVEGHDGRSKRGRTTKIWEEEKDQQFVEPVSMSSLSKEENSEDFVSWMALLKIKEVDAELNQIRKPLIHTSSSLLQGDTMYLCGTPFGSMCPSVFLNSISKGILTNASTPKNTLMMTDARCMPGSEGGGVYIIPRNESPRKRRLVGLIIAPLCWKANEWIGLSLLCSYQSILESLRALVHWDNHSEPVISEDTLRRGSQMRSLEQSMHGVVLVRVGAVWGSGVVVDRSKGIIITCYHVIKNAKENRVQVRLDYPHQHWSSAEVLYATGPKATYDLAFLKLLNSEDQLLPCAVPTLPTGCVQHNSHYQTGSEVYVIGHALIGPGASMLPSVSSGVMSKVVTNGDQPVMLQSSCAVHSGASGGALVCAKTGALLGVVSSNSRDTDTGASFPHVNFSIPMTVVQPVLQQYFETKDVSVFNQLSREHVDIKALWRLEESNKKWTTSENTSKL